MKAVTLKVKRRKSVTNPSFQKVVIVDSHGDDIENIITGRKRKNPFANSAVQERNPLAEQNESASRGYSLLQGLQKIEKASHLSTNCKIDNTNNISMTTDCETNKSLEAPESDLSEKTLNKESKFSKKNNYTNSYEKLPMDWSLKHRARFLSSNAFTACSGIRPLQESKGLSQFVRCNHSNSDFGSAFTQCLSLWVHPSIPSLPSYPVAANSTGLFNRSESLPSSSFANDPATHKEIMRIWRDSFQSLFGLLKSNFCPFFYLASHGFTVLFKARIMSAMALTATIAPTTKGFREMLKKEGIQFDMPLANNQHDEDIGDDCEDRNHKEGNAFNEEDQDEFLDSIGLNVDQHFPAMKEKQLINAKSKLKKIDHRLESTVVISGGDVLGLFNFLLNANFLCASSGRMMGIPPSLLSPVAFIGASLKMNRFTHGVIRQQEAQDTKQVYYVDIRGTILPTQLLQLTKLFSNMQEDVYSVHLGSYDRTFAFNIAQKQVKKERTIFDGNEARDYGVSEEAFEYLNSDTILSLPDSSELLMDGDSCKF